MIGVRSMCPCQTFPGLRIPLDQDRLTHRQFSDLRFIEVGSNALLLQVRHLQQQLALFHKLRRIHVQAVDGAR